MTVIDELRAHELRLQAAQLNSDVSELDALLHPQLRFVAPDGAVFTKADDLQSHRSGAMKLEVLEPLDLEVLIADRIGVTMLTARLAGEFQGNRFDSRMQYIRTWTQSPNGWQIVTASAVMMPGSA